MRREAFVDSLLRLIVGLALAGPGCAPGTDPARGGDAAPPCPNPPCVSAACSPATEAMDCAPDQLCLKGQCIEPPPCGSDADCASFGATLSCEPAAGRCQRPAAPDAGAPGDSAGSPPPGSPPPGSPPPGSPPPDASAPGACSSDQDCCPFAPGCGSQVEHCQKAKGAAQGTCQAGCRSHLACQKIGLESCNGLYQCIKGGKQGDACDEGFPAQDLDDCRFGYYCCPILKQCFEQCKTPGETCPDTKKKCVGWLTGPKCFG